MLIPRKSVAIAVLGTFLGPVALSQFAFQPAVNYSTSPGLRPNGVITVDLDGDNWLDIATANFNSDDVTVLINNQDGTFAAPVSYATGPLSADITACDFDGDGDQDLAVARSGLPGGVSVLENLGGTFAAPIQLAAGNRPSGIGCCDLNGDGQDDIVVCNFASGLCGNNDARVTVLLNTGALGFSLAGSYVVDCNPWDIVCCDLNGDGNVDVACSNDQGSNVSVLLGNGTGALGAASNYPTSIASRRLECCDLDLDGDLDLVVGTGANALVVLWNSGAGTFSPPSPWTTGPFFGPNAVACGDFDCDGLPDIAAVNNNPGSVTLLRGGGGMTFPQQMDLGIASDPRAIAVGDLDRNGTPDLVSAGTNSSTLTVLLNDGCRCIPLPTNGVLWLALDEASGVAAGNAVGGPGGVHAFPLTPATGKVAGAATFNGTSDYVEVPDYASINPGTGDFTVDVWVKRDALSGGTEILVDKRTIIAGVVTGYSFFLVNGFLSAQLADGGFSNYVDTTTPVPLDGRWHLAALTVDRTSATGGKFYLDGALVSTFNPLGRPGSLTNASPLRVGSRSSSLSAFFHGELDEVEVFTRALDASEINALAAAGSAGKCKDGCVLPWDEPFCQNQTAVSVTAQICNESSMSRTYSYSFAGLPVGPGCSIPGPTVFSPSSGTITVPANTCLPVPVTITRPVAMTAVYQVGCYEMTVTNLANGISGTCRGSVQDRRDICVVIPQAWADLEVFVPAPLGPIVVSNNQSVSVISIRVISVDTAMNPDRTRLSLNGLDPGVPLELDLQIPPGGIQSFDLVAEYLVPDPLSWTTLLIESDVERDGVWEPLASMGVRGRLPSTTTLGDNYCGPAVVNSSGGSASMSAQGSAVAADNDFTLTASGLPANQFALFLNSQIQGFTPNVGGSQGNLCIAGRLGRHNNSLQASGTLGMAMFRPDLTAMPTPGGAVQVMAGETWNFQCWFRDANPQATSNFTDALSITWQ